MIQLRYICVIIFETCYSSLWNNFFDAHMYINTLSYKKSISDLIFYNKILLIPFFENDISRISFLIHNILKIPTQINCTVNGFGY